jgi:hypothetical protein
MHLSVDKNQFKGYFPIINSVQYILILVFFLKF